MESNNIDINSDIGTQIRKKREEKGWSQTELANKVFLTQQSISKIERGEMLPSLDKIADFIRILGISVYIPPEKLEEKVITHEITNTKNCKVFEMNGQYILLTNSNYLCNESTLKKFVGQNCVETYTVNPILMMNEIFGLISNDNDICKFTDAVEKYTNINKTSKTLLTAIISYLFHYCGIEIQNISYIMKMVRSSKIDEDYKDHLTNLDYIFNHLEKKNPNSFACNQYKTYTCDFSSQNYPIVELNDIFKYCEYESANNKAHQFENVNKLFDYLMCEEIENKIISVNMKENKIYGNIIYKYLQHVLSNEPQKLNEKLKKKINEELKKEEIEEEIEESKETEETREKETEEELKGDTEKMKEIKEERGNSDDKSVEIIGSYHIFKTMKKEYLRFIPSHGISYPVIRYENGKYYLAIYAFYYDKQDKKMIGRPKNYALFNFDTGVMEETYDCRRRDFTSGNFRKKYDILDKKYKLDKKDLKSAFKHLDKARKLLKAGQPFIDEYEQYMKVVLSQTTKEYQQFYNDLSHTEKNEAKRPSISVPYIPKMLNGRGRRVQRDDIVDENVEEKVKEALSNIFGHQ